MEYQEKLPELGENKARFKAKSLQKYLTHAEFHVGHHYDQTKGPLKNAFIEIEMAVFGGSSVKIEVKRPPGNTLSCGDGR